MTRWVIPSLGTLVFLLVASPVDADAPPSFLMEWGSFGSGQGQFDNARAIAVDHNGNTVLVAERWNRRVQMFTTDGSFIDSWSFSSPRGVACEPDGTFYVVDAVANTVNKFSSSGSLITSWGSYGTGDGQFATPLGIAVDGNGSVYVCDTYNYRIQKFTNTGSFVTAWGTQGNGNDDGPGVFFVPKGVAADGNGNVYVADSGNHRIQKFNTNGTFLAEWGSLGGALGQFNNPYGVAANGTGVYVSDTFNHRIQRFSSNGTFLSVWGSGGTGQSQFDSPQGVAVDGNGNVYAADTENYRVQKFGDGGGTQTGIADGGAVASARLHPSTPNPFLNRTQVRFDIEEPGQVKLQVFDFKGRLVNSLTDAYTPQGSYTVSWDGRAANGERVAAGAYFFRLVAGNTVATQKAFLVR